MGRRILVTGGAGFIGSSVVRHLIGKTAHDVFVVDKLTYAGSLDSLAPAARDPRYRFLQADICDKQTIARTFADFRPDIVMHLAAESHVDRSIDGPMAFVATNIGGTAVLLNAALDYWRRLPADAAAAFRFHHVSTDEVYGSLQVGEAPFGEDHPYRPSSPYAASKAASDHLARAWQRTYGLPVVVSNCSNNYGPYQFPEKLIPLMILNALEGKPLPVYGSGANIRDWLFVEDHIAALLLVAERGVPGATYNIGGAAERTNLAVVETLCGIIDELAPDQRIGRRAKLIAFVADRPGHDLRYAIDSGKIARELGWAPRETFDTGLRRTVSWYLENRLWWERVRSGGYRGERLGVLT